MTKVRRPAPPPAAAPQPLDSYTIKGTSKSIHAGDSVLMRAPDSGKPPYVARVEAIETDRRGVRVRVRWYYRPEESIGGRRKFHGSKELFLSDHYDVQSADTIEGKCNVYTFKEYTGLRAVGEADFFSRFQYQSATGTFIPDRIDVFCKCEMPYNPDDLMIQCDDCSDWFHPACIDMTAEEAKKIKHFFCQICSSEKEEKPTQNAEKTARQADLKVDSKRRKK